MIIIINTTHGGQAFVLLDTSIPSIAPFYSFYFSIAPFYSFSYIYIYIYVYLYIYKKLSPKWKKFHEQKVFFFFDFTYCVKISVR